MTFTAVVKMPDVRFLRAHHLKTECYTRHGYLTGLRALG